MANKKTGGKKGGGGAKSGGTKSGGGRKGGGKGGGRKSGGGGKSERGNGAPKSAAPKRSNGLFDGLGDGLKTTAVGVGGGLTSRLSAEGVLGLGRYLAPTVELLYAGWLRPLVTFGLAKWWTPAFFGLFGAAARTKESAKIGGYIMAGLDLIDDIFESPIERLSEKFRFGDGGGAVETTERTALPPASAQAVVEQATQAGAQAGAEAALGALGWRERRGGAADDDPDYD